MMIDFKESYMKNYYLMLIILSLAGCDLLSTRLNEAEASVAESDRLAKSKEIEYKVEIREVKTYEPYHYANKIEDPFRVRGFLMTEEMEAPVTTKKDSTPVCSPPTCVPPKTHSKQFLENYSLDDLAFVGTLKRGGSVALIKTPDLGIVQVRKGDYMGRKNGKILAIKETAIILQEKVYKSGIWEDKKTVLMINK